MSDEKDLTKPETAIEKPRPSIFAAKKVGVAARLEAAKQSYSPEKLQNRLGVIFDNSGSMSGKPIEDAKVGFDEFLKACNPTETSVALYGFGPDQKYHLTLDFVGLGITASHFGADFGTPLYGTMKDMIEKEPLSRGVIFSDGEPTDAGNPVNGRYWGDTAFNPDEIIDKYVEAKIPVDTVYIGPDNGRGAEVLKHISDRTGGIFMRFTDTGNFRKAFKYLAPGFRGYLSDGNFRKQIGATDK